MELAGSTAVVTGAARGIGAAIARALAREGAAAVLVADLDAAGAQQVATEVAELGATATAHQVDVGDARAVTAMVHAAEAAHGPLDLVVSNAGIGTNAGLEADLDDWDRSWRINVLAHVNAARAALPGMLERGRGGFVHTCSAAGLLTMIGDAPYAVTKHGAVAFAEWLSVTYGRRGIQVHALCPQGVDTELLREGAGGTAEQVVRASGPVLAPEDVADEVIAALADGRFLVLPHPEVGRWYAQRAADPDRWLASMRELAERFSG